MHPLRQSALLLLLALTDSPLLAETTDKAPKTTETYIREMTDLKGLSTFPATGYKTIQFSSYDRKSQVPLAEDWDANADGFGNEPIPGVEEVLKEPAEGEKIGEYLLCDVKSPGVIVRSFTAGINGTLKVYLDDMEKPVYDGPAWQFIHDSWKCFLDRKYHDDPAIKKLFSHQDASYLPMPFARRCRIVWTGRLDQLHFYAIQMRVYPESEKVRTFSPADLEKAMPLIRKAGNIFTSPGKEYPVSKDAKTATFAAQLPPETMVEALSIDGAGCGEYLEVEMEARDLMAALRGTVMYIRFDNCSMPQVESPVCDFFGAGPGVVPYESLPFTITKEGKFSCRLPMPFQKRCQIFFRNYTDKPVKVKGVLKHAPHQWTDDSMYLFAHWRVSNDIASVDPFTYDLPFVCARGKGCFIGTSVMLYNPSPMPSSYGSWWGEGDEKVFVDNESHPSAFGTGSEDYFNYSWSIPHLFQHAYCGQPLDEGPANRGFVVNYRWQFMDRIPFRENFFFYMELKSHLPTRHLSYARLAYYYAVPGATDDHSPIGMADVKLPKRQPWTPGAQLGSYNAKFYPFEEIIKEKDQVSTIEDIFYADGKAVQWKATDAAKTLTCTLDIKQERDYTIRLVTGRTTDSPAISVAIDGKPVKIEGRDEFDLKSDYLKMLRAVACPKMKLSPGKHTITIKQTRPGTAILDFLWVQ